MVRQWPIAFRRVASSLALASVALETGCPGGLDASFFDVQGVGTSMPFEDASAACPDVPTAILATTCATAGCHAATNPQGGLDLASPGLVNRLAGRSASQGGVLVDPGSPSSSVLYTKLTAAVPFGARMPFGQKPLDPSTVACVLQWIQGLAPDAATGDSQGLDEPSSPTPVASSSSDADAAEAGPTSTWTPANEPGTVLWLDASQQVTTSGSTVTGWSDRSGYHNNAAPTAAATAPTLVAAAAHGMPALRFDQTRGTFVSITDSASLQWGKGGFVVAIVATDRRATAGLGHGGGVSTVFAKPHPDGGGPREIAIHLNFFTAEKADDDSVFHFGLGEDVPGIASTTHGYNDGVPRLYVARRSTSGTTAILEVRVNGMTVGTTTGAQAVDVTLAGSPVRIGSTYGQNVEGDVAEVVAVRGALDDAGLARLESYLTTKYELSE